MKHRLLSLALAGTGVACTLVAGQAPAAAGQGDPKKKQIAETECRDIVGGTARYDRDRLVDALPEPYNSYEENKADSGVATLALQLSAPSCSTVTYTLFVYGADGTELNRASTVGDGSSGTEASPLTLTATVRDYPQNCLLLVATTIAHDVVVDTAPDVTEWDYEGVCDGGAPGLTYK